MATTVVALMTCEPLSLSPLKLRITARITNIVEAIANLVEVCLKGVS